MMHSKITDIGSLSTYAN